MGKNVLASLALAGSMLAAEPIKGQEEITDARVGKTKEAVVQVIDRLDWTPEDPTIKYPAALKRFHELLVFMEDDKLTAAEHGEILKNTELLAKIDQEGAEAIRNSLLGVPTVIAEKQVAALNESPEERKERLQREKREKLQISLLEDFRKYFYREENWERGSQGSEDITVEIESGIIKIIYKGDDSWADIGNKSGVGTFNGKLASWEYALDIEASSRPILWLLDGAWKCIGMDWNIPEKGKERIVLNTGNQTVQIPENCGKITIWFITTALQPEITVNKFDINPIKK